MGVFLLFVKFETMVGQFFLILIWFFILHQGPENLVGFLHLRKFI
jgi:hypothetical protein